MGGVVRVRVSVRRRARIWVRHRVRVGSYVLGDETTLSVVC